MSDLKLAFGLRDIPDEIDTAWGARLIWPNDLLHDRQDLNGPDREALVEWLMSGPVTETRDRLARLAHDDPTWHSRLNETRTIYEDEHGIVRANPQSSCGYVYVAAWLKTTPDEGDHE